MAVVQISKIQQRRGQKLLNGMPQLSAAELAWAVDTQQLYIGNGSITEGAPYVGNTRILTEHDNLFELTSGYRFANDDLSITASISRSLQSKLDEVQVSVLDFGPDPLPSIDYSQYFTTAFRQLFQNNDTRYRKVLIIPNGTYVFSTVLRIPSNIVLQGETRDGVILNVGTTGIEFLSADNTVEFDFTSTDRPENIRISDLTITYSNGTTNLTGVKDSYFNNVKWVSDYVLGDDISDPVLPAQTYDVSGVAETGDISVTGGESLSGISDPILTSLFLTGSNVVSVIDDLVEQLMSDNTFTADFVATRNAESLVITATLASGFSASDILDYFMVYVRPVSTTISPTNIIPVATEASSGIENSVAAVGWTNTIIGLRTNNISFTDCVFDSVGLGIKSIHNGAFSSFETELFFDNCQFYNCDTAIFVGGHDDTQINNWCIDDCHFESIAKQAVFITAGTGTTISRPRFKNCGNDVNGPADPSSPIVEFGTIYGNVLVDVNSDRHQAAGITLVSTTVGVPEVKNAGSVNFINDNYARLYNSNSFYPLAVFSAECRFITVDYVMSLSNYVRKGQLVLSIGELKTTVAIADNYTYSPSLITDTGGSMITGFEFDATLVNRDGETGNDTVSLTYRNPLGTSLVADKITYSVSYGV